MLNCSTTTRWYRKPNGFPAGWACERGGKWGSHTMKGGWAWVRISRVLLVPWLRFFCFVPYEQQLSSLFLGFFVIFFCNMPPKSRAIKRLMPHNRSPVKSGRKRPREEPNALKNRHIQDRSGSSRSSRHHSWSPSKKRRSAIPESPEDEHMPAWAKKLLEAHNKSEERL